MGTKAISTMIGEVRALNTDKGWRTGENTAGDYIALLHSEISEMLEAYRDHRLAEFTTAAGKPDDVGSEAADVLIRVLDTCDVFDVFDIPLDALTLAGVPRAKTPTGVCSFGDHVSWLHKRATAMQVPGSVSQRAASRMLSALLTVCDTYKIDLSAEYERKMAYGWTRPYQHGGRTLAGDKTPAA